MDTVEFLINNCYAHEGKAYYRDYDNEWTAEDFARLLWREHMHDSLLDDMTDEKLGEYMYDCLQYGYDDIVGLIAMIYMLIWTKAEVNGEIHKGSRKSV